MNFNSLQPTTGEFTCVASPDYNFTNFLRKHVHNGLAEVKTYHLWFIFDLNPSQ